MSKYRLMEFFQSEEYMVDIVLSEERAKKFYEGIGQDYDQNSDCYLYAERGFLEEELDYNPIFKLVECEDACFYDLIEESDDIEELLKHYNRLKLNDSEYNLVIFNTKDELLLGRTEQSQHMGRDEFKSLFEEEMIYLLEREYGIKEGDRCSWSDEYEDLPDAIIENFLDKAFGKWF